MRRIASVRYRKAIERTKLVLNASEYSIRIGDPILLYCVRVEDEDGFYQASQYLDKRNTKPIENSPWYTYIISL